MNSHHHRVSAFFELIPAWLRFLEARGLIDAQQHSKTLEELRPLGTDLIRTLESYHDDPTLFHAMRDWPARPQTPLIRARSPE